MKRYKIPFIKPDFPAAEDIAKDYKEILAANWFTNFGPFEERFSKKIANYIGEEYYACTLSNATAALLASILAVLGKGDGTKYVLMPSFTFVAGAAALTWCGYKPLFIDIENKGLHMDIDQAEKAINEGGDNIAAILFCNAFGVGATDIEAWESLAASKNVPLIIDSAAGFGSLYSSNRKVGGAGKCEIFSFHATKPFAIGEGGAVVSRDSELIEKIISIQNFGFNGGGNAAYLGFNGKLEEVNAAIGLRQFERFSNILEGRRRVWRAYQQGLPPKFKLQKNAANASLCFAAVLAPDEDQRDTSLKNLIENGVEAKTYYNPSIHKQSYYKNFDRYSELTVTNDIDSRILSLPIHDNMSDDDLKLIIDTLND